MSVKASDLAGRIIVHLESSQVYQLHAVSDDLVDARNVVDNTSLFKKFVPVSRIQEMARRMDIRLVSCRSDDGKMQDDFSAISNDTDFTLRVQVYKDDADELANVRLDLDNFPLNVDGPCVRVLIAGEEDKTIYCNQLTAEQKAELEKRKVKQKLYPLYQRFVEVASDAGVTLYWREDDYGTVTFQPMLPEE